MAITTMLFFRVVALKLLIGRILMAKTLQNPQHWNFTALIKCGKAFTLQLMVHRITRSRFGSTE